MWENVDSLRAVDSQFNAWGAWLEECPERKRMFDADTCRAMMEAFTSPLVVHLEDKIRSLLALKPFGVKLDY